MIYLFRYYLFCCLIIYPIRSFSLKLDWDAGYFKTSGSESINQSDFLTRLDGQLKYDYQQHDRIAFLILKARPEIYGFDNHYRSLKLMGSGSYFQNEDILNWGLSFSARNNIYKGNDFNINHSIIIFQADGFWHFSDIVPINTTIGYTYQNINLNGNRNLDLIYLEASADKIISPFFKVGYGGYIERFIIQNNYTDPFRNINEKNKGLRIGPLINIKYLKQFIANTEYRFLLHYSDFTNYPSYEQQIKLLAGKVLLSKLSIFLLLDFYFRNFTFKENQQPDLLYTPLNLENRYYIKLAYDIFDDWEIFTKYGYSKENIDGSVYSLAGWSFTVGFEFNKTGIASTE